MYCLLYVHSVDIWSTYMSGSSRVWTLAAYRSSSSLETSTFSPSVKSSLVSTQLGTAQGKTSRIINISRTIYTWKHCWKISSSIFYIESFCCCVNDCCLLLLRSCCHPSETPHRPQSSPEADSLLVPLAGEQNRRDGRRINKCRYE